METEVPTYLLVILSAPLMSSFAIAQDDTKWKTCLYSLDELAKQCRVRLGLSWFNNEEECHSEPPIPVQLHLPLRWLQILYWEIPT